MEKLQKEVKVSFIVPYKRRLDNLKLLFQALSKQTMDKSEFEVVVGAMEYNEDYVQACKEYENLINIQTVMSSREWQVAYARNIAIKQAVGKILVFLDADMIIGPHFLENLYDNHFSNGEIQCIIGQMVDYDNNNFDVTEVNVRPYGEYEKILLKLEAEEMLEYDQRFKIDCTIPWSYVWTALIVIPRKQVEEENLYFDLSFHGYGVEDLEWAYRIWLANLPIVLKKDVWGIHLPHQRNIKENKKTEQINFRYFLKKWQDIGIELMYAFGDFDSNRKCNDFKTELGKLLQEKDTSFAILKGTIRGKSVLIVGAIQRSDGTFVNQIDFPDYETSIYTEIHSIVGLALPYEDNSLDECYKLPALYHMDEIYSKKIDEECERVLKNK